MQRHHQFRENAGRVHIIMYGAQEAVLYLQGSLYTSEETFYTYLSSACQTFPTRFCVMPFQLYWSSN